jgi:hypothetical protein
MNQLNQIFRKTFLFFVGFLGLTSISNAQCGAGEVEVFIDVVTDAYGYEAYWELVPTGEGCGTPATIFSGGNTVVGCLGGGARVQDPGGYANSSTITEPAGPTGFCLTIGDTFDIIAVDDWGDGGTCFNSIAQGFSFCMPGGSANNVFTFVASSPIQDDIEVISNAIEYTTVPLSQVPVTGMILSADVRNNGSAAVSDAVLTANVYELNANVFVQTSSSIATSINAGLVSTINAGSFTPSTAGVYLFEYISSMTAVTDSDNTNDTLRSIIQITDDGSYARDNFTLAVSLGLNTSTYGELGNVFEYPNSGYKMDSVLFYMQPSTVGDTTEIKIYDVVAGVPNTLIGTSGLIIISNTDTAGVLKMVPVTNLAGGPLAITSPKVFVSLSDSYTGFLGLGFATEIYTPGGTYANINGGAWTEMATLGFPNPAIIRPYSSFDCSVLTLSTAVTSSFNGADVSCIASADGEATATAAGTSGYIYTWDANAGAQNTSIATGLTAGVYVVSVTDTVCTTIDTITLTAPDSFSVAVDSFANVSCNGGTDGLVAVTIGGATAPYTYNWSNGATTDDLFGLTAGTYFGTVTDANGCVVVAPVPVVEPDSFSIAVDSFANVACNGGTDGLVAITLTGGTTPYNFNWSNGATTDDLFGLSAGTYFGTVTDANGCSTVAPVPITEPTALVASTVDNGNGSATVSAVGGVSPYVYLWSNSTTSSTATGLASGSYVVTVTDANGCEDTSVVNVVVTSVDNIDGLGALKMFPNPAEAQVTLDIQLEYAMDVEIRVLNVTGQTVLNAALGTIQTQREVLDLTKLISGVYTVQINMGTEMISKKLIVNKQ